MPLRPLPLQPVTLMVADLFVQMDTARGQTARLHGISPLELSALTLIGFGDGVTPSTLAARLNLQTGSVTAMVDRLTHQQLVARVANPADRRSLLIVATAVGRQVAATTAQALDDVVTEALVSVPKETLDEAMKVMALIVDGVAAFTVSTNPAADRLPLRDR